MKETQDPRNDFKSRLARYFLIAYSANYHDVTFKTAEGYIKGEREVGELWLALADTAIKWVNSGLNDQIAEEEEIEPENVIPLGQVDWWIVFAESKIAFDTFDSTLDERFWKIKKPLVRQKLKASIFENWIHFSKAKAV
jgi:hypothetical protein